MSREKWRPKTLCVGQADTKGQFKKRDQGQKTVQDAGMCCDKQRVILQAAGLLTAKESTGGTPQWANTGHLYSRKSQSQGAHGESTQMAVRYERKRKLTMEIQDGRDLRGPLSICFFAML